MPDVVMGSDRPCLLQSRLFLDAIHRWISVIKLSSSRPGMELSGYIQHWECMTYIVAKPLAWRDNR